MSSPARFPRRTHVRFGMLALVFVNVVINYMDRTNLSVAATALSRDLNLSTLELGLLFSAFGWTYAALQLPGGLLADKIRPRVLYAFSLVAWSTVTLLQGVVSRFGALFSLRLGVGTLEAPAYPINNLIATRWFPAHERARAIAIYTSGQYVGLALLAPAMMALQAQFGWRLLFIITGAVGIVWGFAWYWLYRDPDESRAANAEEIAYIRGNNAASAHAPGFGAPARGVRWKELREVIRHRKLWGIYIGQFCLGANMWFFMTWFPTYLVKYRGFTFIKTGYFTAVPFLAAFAGILLSGFVSDLLVTRGVSAGVARKTPVILGLLLASTIVGANYVDDPLWIIVIMGVAFFGTGMASITWVFVSLLAPPALLGVTGGMFNFIGNLSSITVPIVIGALVDERNFSPALVFVSAVGVVGMLSYTFLVGKIERIQTGR